LVGRILGGRYQLNEFIGSGGMGEIYRARRTHIGDTVAVKVLRADVVSNEKTRQRFYREARAAAMLHHPNAVVIHDFGEDTDGLAYIVMELLVGRSLRQTLAEEGALDPLRTYGIVRQACAALEAGHRSGIVHRDVKPDNIILLSHDEDHDHVKILDFGIAKLRDKALDTLSVENNLTNVGTVIGTPNYMSPEQCQGEEADARSDLYSLGVVMYEMLTGVMPFIAKTPTGVAIKHVTAR
jgi:eukaryotic-like serine/threonine-protein kinase